ncbi:MAG: cysteine desulfurase NifS [Elusimicrobiota bacterium]|jgi:cysteine desulfurase|nr:cysteine desulfurase NifS [Elusimicrobiota bacterium]
MKVYLDNSATTSVDPAVVKEMLPYFEQVYGNASSFYSFGREAKAALDKSRETVAGILGAKADEIFFTSGGTESDNLAIFGSLSAIGKKGHIITSKIEHHAVLYSFEHLEKMGYEVTYLNVDKNGSVSVEELEKSIKDNTLLVSIMHANNEIGTLQPIKEISTLLSNLNNARKDKIYFHTDAVQTAGKVPIDVKDLDIDYLSLSAHKFNGPKGIGVLYVKRGSAISPIMYGGHQENGLRSGTENIPYIVGLSKALELSAHSMASNSQTIARLRDKLQLGIINKIPEVLINGNPAKSIPNILNASFRYIEGESLLARMDAKGISASAGSACATGSLSHVLAALGVNPVDIQGAVRFSFGHNNTEADVDYVLEVLPEIVAGLRKMSPLWKGK